ncbi:hypothetical protein M426DRAFT_128554 [Hypoxylon sp. CI-4A]|nr:hypothetical protein M426DRAFT_128554 [Hypoxylon sp. CI-4A]
MITIMASVADESEEYRPSEEDSNDSSDDDEEYYESRRPNRWRGPDSTWQFFNAEEINTYTALTEIRNRDLSVHLYNAFSLKQTYKRSQDGPVSGKDIDKSTGQVVQLDDWLPQRTWTAWPMRADKVPSPQDFANDLHHDPNERFTLRKAIREMPSTALEEIIGARTLKMAKEKFNARPWVEESASDRESQSGSGGGSENEEASDAETSRSTSVRVKRSRSKSINVKYEDPSGDERMDVDEQQPEHPPLEDRTKEPLLRPAIAIDDGLSYSILRPSVRHILTNLDTTLTILHNMRESTINYQSDSGDSEASDSSQRPRTPPTGKKRGRPLGSVDRTRSRGRSQERQKTVSPSKGGPPAPPKEAKGKRAGRPKKMYPRLEGETDREYAIRIARLQKKPIPIFTDEPEPEPEPESSSDTDNAGSDSGNSGDDEEIASTNHTETKRRKRKGERGTKNTSRASSTSTASGQQRNSQTGKKHVGLRDWRDVLGAASLAGFPSAALDRAARRCADLFGQDMTLHTLLEAPAGSSRKASASRAVTTYVPGMPYPPLLDPEDEEEEDDDDDNDNDPSPRQMAVRGGTSEDEAGRSPARSRSVSQARGRSRSKSRSRSASAAPGAYLCSIPDCPRSVAGEGFSRRQNLLRHLKLVHGFDETTTTTTTRASPGAEAGAAGAVVVGGVPTVLLPEDVDSEDEMLGAVHVDGFLRPIKMQRGWRTEDVSLELRRKKSGL